MRAGADCWTQKQARVRLWPRGALFLRIVLQMLHLDKRRTRPRQHAARCSWLLTLESHFPMHGICASTSSLQLRTTTLVKECRRPPRLRVTRLGAGRDELKDGRQGADCSAIAVATFNTAASCEFHGHRYRHQAIYQTRRNKDIGGLGGDCFCTSVFALVICI